MTRTSLLIALACTVALVLLIATLFREEPPQEPPPDHAGAVPGHDTEPEPRGPYEGDRSPLRQPASERPSQADDANADPEPAAVALPVGLGPLDATQTAGLRARMRKLIDATYARLAKVSQQPGSGPGGTETVADAVDRLDVLRKITASCCNREATRSGSRTRSR